MSKPRPEQNEVTYRKLHTINVAAFKQDMANTPSLGADPACSVVDLLKAYMANTPSLGADPACSVVDLLKAYNNSLSSLIDTHTRTLVHGGAL